MFLIILLFTGLFGCGDDNNATPTTSSQTELLTANNWRTTRVTTPDGTQINPERLNLSTQVLYNLNMQFRANGRVNALDPKQSNFVVNGGTWKLATDSKSIDVVVTGFNGNFPIIRLDRTKLILRQRAPVDGQNADINLEFDPSL